MGDELPSVPDVAEQLQKMLNLRPKPVAARQMYDELAAHFRLTSAQLALREARTHRSLWENRVRTAREHLAKLGRVHRQPRNRWSLTDEGRAWARAAEGPGTPSTALDF